MNIYFKPFWQLPDMEEMNRQMLEIQNIPYLIRERHPEYRDRVY
jgi:hypothetical protein